MFVTKCGKGNLANPVVLGPTVEDLQKVELYEDGRGLWLKNGWQKFVDHYKLSHGDYPQIEYKSYSRVVMLGPNSLDLVCLASSFHNLGLNGNQELPEGEEEEETGRADSVKFLGSSVVKNMKSNGGGVSQTAQRRSSETAKQKALRSSTSEFRFSLERKKGKKKITNLIIDFINFCKEWENSIPWRLAGIPQGQLSETRGCLPGSSSSPIMRWK